MSLPNYMGSESEIKKYESDYSNEIKEAQEMLMTNMRGVEGIPYQFMDTVDRRIVNTEIGRKFGEKIIARLPLLFLTPCKQLFMDDFNEEDKTAMANLLATPNVIASSDLFEGSGKYYSVEFDYTEYYKYLNTMLNSIAAYLNMYNTEINIGNGIQRLGAIDWSNDNDEAFKTFFSAKENVIFYLDGMTEVSESFSNDTTDSSLASQINGFADQAREIDFLFGGQAGAMLESAGEITSTITASLSNVMGKLGGGIVKSLSETGVNTVLNGGKIVFPQIWSNSSYDRSFSLNIKLRSPDHDSLSIYMNILKPYCKLLAMVLPRISVVDKAIDPNAYKEPFLVKAYSKGLFNIDMGIISSMNVTKGAECCWNDDGLPTQIDITLEIRDLYSSLSMSNSSNLTNVVKNTAFMDYLANMAGLNIGQMQLFRRAQLFLYLTQSQIFEAPSHLFTKFDNNISKLIGRLYNLTS